MPRSLTTRLPALLLALMLIAAACGGDDPSAAEAEAIETNEGGVLVKPPDVLEGETEVTDGRDPTAADASAAPDTPFVWFDGEESSIAALQGQPTVINFWASTCPPCIAEMPEFEEVFQDIGDEVAFVGMNTGDRRDAALRLAEQTGVTYPLADDASSEVFRSFGGFVMPTTVFLSAEGEVAYRWAGVLTGDELRRLIDEHIAPGTFDNA